MFTDIVRLKYAGSSRERAAAVESGPGLITAARLPRLDGWAAGAGGADEAGWVAGLLGLEALTGLDGRLGRLGWLSDCPEKSVGRRVYC